VLRAGGVEDEVGLSAVDDLRARPARELHGEVADAAAGAGDDHALTALQTAVVEERLPRAEAGEGDRRALDVVERLRLRRHDRRRHDRVLGGAAVPVEGRQREHLVVYR
jgi:hypothetical protein